MLDEARSPRAAVGKLVTHRALDKIVACSDMIGPCGVLTVHAANAVVEQESRIR